MIWSQLISSSDRLRNVPLIFSRPSLLRLHRAHSTSTPPAHVEEITKRLQSFAQYTVLFTGLSSAENRVWRRHHSEWPSSSSPREFESIKTIQIKENNQIFSLFDTWSELHGLLFWETLQVKFFFSCRIKYGFRSKHRFPSGPCVYDINIPVTAPSVTALYGKVRPRGWRCLSGDLLMTSNADI